MNREEAKNKVMTIYGSLSEDMKQAIDTLLDVPADMMPLAVKAEAMKAYRELMGDYVSRKAVEEITWEEPAYSDKYNVLTWVRDKVRELPSATPDLSEYSDKLWERAYERGKREGLNIPEGATNGDVIKAMFPTHKIEELSWNTYFYMNDDFVTFDVEWWNAPYKQEVEE